MTAEEVHNKNNNLRGTEYACRIVDDHSPVRRGMITIDGSVLRFSVYPERTSKQGRVYNPIQLEYMPDCKFVLKAVKIDG